MGAPSHGISWAQLLRPLLQHGLDPLGPAGPWSHLSASLLVHCLSSEARELMLEHLDAQRAAGTLQLGTKRRCLQLLLGACRSDEPWLQLVQHALSQLQQLSGAEVVGASDTAALSAALLAAAAAGHPAVLSALLATGQLPWDLAAMEPDGPPYYSNQRGYSLLAAAAMSPQPAACVRLLYEAGAVPTAADLYCAIGRLAPNGVAALLACGAPDIDTSEPSLYAPLPAETNSRLSWSCPIHRTLHFLCDVSVLRGLPACRPSLAAPCYTALPALRELPPGVAEAAFRAFGFVWHSRQACGANFGGTACRRHPPRCVCQHLAPRVCLAAEQPRAAAAGSIRLFHSGDI